MTRPRSTTSQADELGAILATIKSRLSSVELMAHSHDRLAKGIIGYTKRTATVASINTSLTTIASLTVNTEINRLYKITTACNVWKEGSANWVNAYLFQDGVQIQRIGRNFLASGYDTTYHATRFYYPTPGVHTYEIRVQFEANSLNAAFATVNNPTFIAVEDVGAYYPASVSVFNAFSDVQTEIGGVDYRVITWRGVGSITVSNSWLPEVDGLILAGGGGGGARHGGGGGAGGVIQTATGIPWTLVPATYDVIVGSGGAGGIKNTTLAGNGGNSSFGSGSGTPFGTLTAIGGGAGGNWNENGAIRRDNGNSGGSGGGGANNVGVSGAGGAGTSGQGFNGGSCGSNGAPWASAGGGGAGGAGGNQVSLSVGGNGGAGITTTITGTSMNIAGGGGAGGGNVLGTAGIGGSGVGGNGGAGDSNSRPPSENGQPGVAWTGSGGGGSRNWDGGSGSSGLVVIRFPLSNQI